MLKKSSLVTLKIEPELLEEFKITATLRGTNMSALLHQFIEQSVREEKLAVPGAFRRRFQVGLAAESGRSEANN